MTVTVEPPEAPPDFAYEPPTLEVRTDPGTWAITVTVQGLAEPIQVGAADALDLGLAFLAAAGAAPSPAGLVHLLARLIVGKGAVAADGALVDAGVDPESVAVLVAARRRGLVADSDRVVMMPPNVVGPLRRPA